ncbi:acyl-CoA dehydrogenase family protein [Actinomarinicola tropica]|uniref:Acyl-CoA dehydrogenase n=1 Tax=Actinomarinicola tropica TaxID=2789776 RepID=A0A5Q2RK65_9ACTN|nr:acyl-CoA dehydrogenase family protein [Actinomarinicola tropica]QGG94961.1 acyl-CoA dehydrogenase [Actinomarinicola tropica]
MTATEARPGTDLVDELTTWLEENWDPDLTVGEWWERLGMAGWAAPMLPENAYGRGLTRGDALLVASTIARFGALGAPQGMSISMASPTIATHATQEQIDRLIPPAVTGKVHYCQLFSEPGAGSDLAGLNTRAIRDGEEWHVTGQKVWTSGGQYADMGMLIARTNPEAPKHQGITWFAIEMLQPGIEIRPLKEMTGHAMFNEVFLDGAVVPDANRIGEVNNGWAATNTTLLHERSGMGARAGTAAGGRLARAGSVVGDLDKRAGDFAPPKRSVTATKEKAAEEKAERSASPAQLYIDLARDLGKLDDPVIRQRLAQAHILGTITRLTTERHKAVRSQGGDIPGVANFSKLLMADIIRLNRDLGMQLLGPRGMLHDYDDETRDAMAELPGGARAVAATAQALGAQALPIYGGTDQIQRNIVGERALGLPKEPGDLSKLPFNELPKNG